MVLNRFSFVNRGSAPRSGNGSAWSKPTALPLTVTAYPPVY
jgi:hypothetical protein